LHASVFISTICNIHDNDEIAIVSDMHSDIIVGTECW
jgi:hypothetical protein